MTNNPEYKEKRKKRHTINFVICIFFPIAAFILPVLIALFLHLDPNSIYVAGSSLVLSFLMGLFGFVYYLKGQIEDLKIPEAIKKISDEEEDIKALQKELKEINKFIGNINGGWGTETHLADKGLEMLVTRLKEERQDISIVYLSRFLDEKFNSTKELDISLNRNIEKFSEFRKALGKYLDGDDEHQGEVREIISNIAKFKKESIDLKRRNTERYIYAIIDDEHNHMNLLLHNFIVIKFKTKPSELWMGGGTSFNKKPLDFHFTQSPDIIEDYLKRFDGAFLKDISETPEIPKSKPKR